MQFELEDSILLDVTTDTPSLHSEHSAPVQNSGISTLMNEFFTRESPEITNESFLGGENEMNWSSNSNSSFETPNTEYIFDRTDVRAIFLTLYTIVFCSCFFGNLMVILVVTLHWRMRSITNFCLANLAFADLCVGIFCVYQNIMKYMMDSWIFGEFMCKMYHFINSLSTTASILILVVICVERYLAIIHPLQARQMLTIRKLRLTIVAVWVISAIISSPRFYYFKTISMEYDGKVEIMCIPNQNMYNSKISDLVGLVLLFIVPLLVISVLYFRIGVSLWKSSTANMPSGSTSAESSSSSCRCESTVGMNSPSQSRKEGEKRSTIFLAALNCLKCKGQRRKRHRRSSGSFYGADKLSYKSMNLTTMNGMNGNETCTLGHGATRNTNGLIISCNGNNTPLQPINSASRPTAYGCTSMITHHSRDENVNPSLQCCTCHNTSLNRGTESVPVSPYLKRDSPPLLSPPPAASISSTDPIVVVKFEKKSSLRKGKRKQCSILIRSAATLNEDGSGASLGEGMNSSFKNYSQNSNASRMGHGNSVIGSLEGCGNTYCSCKEQAVEGGFDPTAMITSSCQICEKNHSQDDITNSETQQDIYPGHVFGPGTLTANSVDGECDRNLDSISHSHHTCKDLNPAPHHHLIPSTNGHQCTSPSHHNTSASTYNFKGIQTTSSSGVSVKGPKRMRVIRSSKYGTRALQCRRRIIKMLILIVFLFAASHLPFHARKMWQYWGKGYKAGGVFSSLFTPITFLIMYAQSGINPILYAFMSRKFRNSFADLLCCNMRRSLKISRNFSVRSTNAIQLSQAA